MKEDRRLSVSDVEKLFLRYTNLESPRQMQRRRNNPRYNFPKSISPPGCHPTYLESEVLEFFHVAPQVSPDANSDD